MRHDLDVRSIRASLQMSQAELARAIGVDQSTVSNWENGTTPRGPARILLENLSRQSSELVEGAQ